MSELQNMWKICPVTKPHSIKAKAQRESMTTQFLTFTDKGSVSASEPAMPATQGAGWTGK